MSIRRVARFINGWLEGMGIQIRRIGNPDHPYESLLKAPRYADFRETFRI